MRKLSIGPDKCRVETPRKDSDEHIASGTLISHLRRGAASGGAIRLPSTTPTTASSSAEEQALVSAIRARANAFSSGDCQGWAAFVDADFRDIEGAHTATRKEILGECQQEARPLPGHKIERLVSDFRFQFVGNIALVDYLYEFKEQFGEVVLTLTDRNVDIYEKRKGKWVALLVASATIVPDPPVAKIDSARFEDFTGEYAWVGARNVETVTRKGDQLYIQGSWEDSATELLPEKGRYFLRARRGGGPAGPRGFHKKRSRSSH